MIDNDRDGIINEDDLTAIYQTIGNQPKLLIETAIIIIQYDYYAVMGKS